MIFPPTPAEVELWGRVVAEIAARDRISVELASENLAALLDSLPAPEPVGDIYPWLDAFHDKRQEVVPVPNGLYTLGGEGDLGTIPVARKRSSMTQLRAETDGGVVVDLAHYGGSRLLFGNGTGTLLANLRLAGFRFINGNITVDSCTDLHFDHGGLSFTRAAWYAQLVAAADKLGYHPTSCDRDPFGDGRNLFGPGIDGCGLTPTQWRKVADTVASLFGPIRIQGSTGASQRIGFHGTDIVGSPDDGIFAAGTFDLMVEGCRLWDISEFENGVSVDPGVSVWGTQEWEDQFHCDAVQIGLNSWRPVVRDSSLGGRIMWNRDTHPSKRKAVGGTGWSARVERVWAGGRRSTPLSGRGYRSGLMALTESTDDVTEPGVVIAAATPADHSGVIRDLTLIARAGNPITYVTAASSKFTSLVRERIQRDDMGLPDVFDEAAIRDHPANPANIWRAAHPY